MLYLLSLTLLPHLSHLLVTRYLHKGDMAKYVRSQTRRSSSKISALISCCHHLHLRDRATTSRSSPLQNFSSTDVLLVQKCLPFGAWRHCYSIISTILDRLSVSTMEFADYLLGCRKVALVDRSNWLTSLILSNFYLDMKLSFLLYVDYIFIEYLMIWFQYLVC